MRYNYGEGITSPGEEEFYLEKRSLEKLARPLLIIVYLILGVLAFHLFVKYLFMWFLPFVIGFAVSRLAIPLCRWGKKKLKMKNGLASALSAVLMMITVLAAVGAVGYVIGLWVVPYIRRVTVTLSGTLEQLTSTWASLIVWMDNILPADISRSIQEAIADLPKNFDFMGKVVSPVLSAAGSLPMMIFSCVVAPLSAFFFTKYDSEIGEILRSALPDKIYEAAARTYHSLFSKLWKWLKAQCILCGIDFVLIFTGLLISGVNNAFMAAALIFCVDFLPVLGSGLVLIPWAIIALLMGNYRLAIGLAIVYIIVLIVRNMFEPHVLGAQINMNPFVTLLSIYAGYKLYGVLGMLMIPLLAITVVQLNDWGYVRLWRRPHPEGDAPPQGKSRLKAKILNRGVLGRVLGDSSRENAPETEKTDEASEKDGK